MKKFLAIALAVLMLVSVLPISALASGFDASVSSDYFQVIAEETYNLAPGATETEMILNNAEGNDRKVVHYFEVNPKNPDIKILPGYYGIDKLDPNNLKLDGVADKSEFWKAEQLTKTVAYYERLGYNVVGAMNTALAYDSDAPYGYMVMNGVVLGTPEVHPGAHTYLAIDAAGNCELREMSIPLNGTEVTAISANFGWIVKNGELTSTNVERTSSDASRSMIGIKADGTLIFCQVDGRNAPISTGLSNYEMGEMMLSLGCVNAVNCDGGGSSTFVSKREGETENVMRSIPSDGSERATINSVILVSNATATGEFDHAILDTDYKYYAPTTSVKINVKSIDTAGFPMELPTEGISWALSDDSFGTVENGVFKSNGKKGDVTVKMIYKGKTVGEKLVQIVDPDVFAFSLDSTVLPYGKQMNITFACTYGIDNVSVFVDGAYTLTLSDPSAATLDGNLFIATEDESVPGVTLKATYNPDPTKIATLNVEYGKGSEVIYDFEDGDTAGFMGFADAKQWSIDNGIDNTLDDTETKTQGDVYVSGPMFGQFNPQLSSTTAITSDVVRKGNYALAWSLDNTDADFANWSYNILFNVGETKVLRDVANGKKATALGMWLYIPEGAAGLAFQSQLYTKNSDGSYSCKQDHFMFTTVSGVRKNLNSCTEDDIPESRWVYASIDISKYDYLCTPIATDEGNSRSPSFIRTYIKPTAPAIHTFYIDDITLDYSPAVEDRVLPTITNLSYATQDESVPLEYPRDVNNNKLELIINGSSIAFSATVSDNLQLDNATGKIYIDGNELENVAVSGKYLATTENVILNAGIHTVKFEIKDAIGNTSVATRTFTVSGDAPIALSGHNDSGMLPEYDSVYYADITVDDITKINKLSASILLQNANTWEPQGLTVANGFKATYTLDKIKGILTVTVERNGDVIDPDEKIIVSAPIRLWSWNGMNYMIGEPISAASHFAGGKCPVVTVDYRVIKGEVEFLDGVYKDSLASFGGNVSQKTMINDIVNPWHTHDSELAVLNKEATCFVDGYSGRTYCETCKSVIDWGTVISAAHSDELIEVNKDATCTELGFAGQKICSVCETVVVPGVVRPSVGHDYQSMKDGKTVCTRCGDEKTTTGLVEIDGNTYYFINGTAVTGWQMIDNEWYYFDTETAIGANGDVKIGEITFNFNNGKLTSGVWVKTVYGKKYYYGPDYYHSRDGLWATIDGKDYFFDNNGIRMSSGYQNIWENQINSHWYYFEEDGSCDRTISVEDGFYTDRNGFGYSKDGKGLSGLHCIDGKYYYFNNKGYALTNSVYAGRLFKDDYAAYTGLVEKDGELYFYQNGLTGTSGLFNIDGDYYYVYWGGIVKTSDTYYVGRTYCDLPVGTYEFGDDGKMLNGIIEKDGVQYLYANGKLASYGLYKIGNDYYFVSGNGSFVTDTRYYAARTYCDLPVGNYTFGSDGKMLDGVVEVDGTLYLYDKGTTVTCGLFEIDGKYYYSYWGGVLKTDGRYYVSRTYCDLPAGNYTFGADGAMLDGVVEVGGTLYLYDKGTTATCGLFEIDGKYYYSYWGGVLQTDGRYYVTRSYCDLPIGNYTFGADGKMLDGFITKDDGIYYYENGNTPAPKMIFVDGSYYYVSWGGKLLTNGTYYVPADGVYNEVSVKGSFNELGQLTI